ncbi:MAG: hypothetical protein ABWY01_02135, partial [Pseudoxanthomonas sp.]
MQRHRRVRDSSPLSLSKIKRDKKTALIAVFFNRPRLWRVHARANSDHERPARWLDIPDDGGEDPKNNFAKVLTHSK